MCVGVASLQSSNDVDIPIAGVRQVRHSRHHLLLHHDGDGNGIGTADAYAEEFWRRDADNRVGNATESDGVPDDGRVPSKSALPKTVAEHGHGMTAGNSIVFRTDKAAQPWPYAEGGVIIA